MPPSNFRGRMWAESSRKTPNEGLLSRPRTVKIAAGTIAVIARVPTSNEDLWLRSYRVRSGALAAIVR